MLVKSKKFHEFINKISNGNKILSWLVIDLYKANAWNTWCEWRDGEKVNKSLKKKRWKIKKIEKL